MRNEKLSYVIRIAAGAYLIYLSVKLIREGILTGDMQGKNMALGIGACILFFGAAGYFIVSSLIKLAKLLTAGQSQEEAEATEEIEEATAEIENTAEENAAEEGTDGEEAPEEETPEEETPEEETPEEAEPEEKTES